MSEETIRKKHVAQPRTYSDAFRRMALIHLIEPKKQRGFVYGREPRPLHHKIFDALHRWRPNGLRRTIAQRLAKKHARPATGHHHTHIAQIVAMGLQQAVGQLMEEAGHAGKIGIRLMFDRGCQNSLPCAIRSFVRFIIWAFPRFQKSGVGLCVPIFCSKKQKDVHFHP